LRFALADELPVPHMGIGLLLPHQKVRTEASTWGFGLWPHLGCFTSLAGGFGLQPRLGFFGIGFSMSKIYLLTNFNTVVTFQ